MSLAQLFSMGRVSKVFKIKGVDFKLVLLDTRVLSEALEAANSADGDIAQSLELKKQILARSLTVIDGEMYIENEDSPERDEIKKVYDVLNKLHVSIINGLYDKYEKLNGVLTKEVDADLKNS